MITLITHGGYSDKPIPNEHILMLKKDVDSVTDDKLHNLVCSIIIKMLV